MRANSVATPENRDAVRPATRPEMIRARRGPAALRVARLSAGMAVQKAAFAYARIARSDPLEELFRRDDADPYPLYERLRAVGPLGRSAVGFRYSADHAVCSRMLTSRDFVTMPPDGVRGFDADMDLSLLQLDPPDHTRLRRVVAPAFARSRLEAYRPLVERTVDRLLAGVTSGRPWDLTTTLSSPLPIAVITAMLGVVDYDEPAFVRFGNALAAALDGVRSPAHAAQLVASSQALDVLFTRLFEKRARDPGSDVVSTLVAAHQEGRVAAEDMLPLCALLLLAGFETTVNLIGNAVLTLQRHPEQWQRLVDDPGLAPQAVEETLRFTPPVHLTGRFALRDTELGGHTLPRGTRVIALLAGANRDPAVFDRPLAFDITRPDAGDHLAFSAGVHYCPGAPLARLEASIALAELVRRFPRLQLAGPVVPRSGVTIRGPRQLPVVG